MNFDQRYYKQLSKDLKLSAEENKSIHLKKINELQHKEAFENGLLLLIAFVVSLAGVAWAF